MIKTKLKAKNQFNVKEILNNYDKDGNVEEISFYFCPMTTLHYREGGKPISCTVNWKFSNGFEEDAITPWDKKNNCFMEEDAIDWLLFGDKGQVSLQKSLFEDKLPLNALLSAFSEEDQELLKDTKVEIYGNFEEEDDEWDDDDECEEEDDEWDDYEDEYDDEEVWTGTFAEFKELALQDICFVPHHNYDT